MRYRPLLGVATACATSFVIVAVPALAARKPLKAPYIVRSVDGSEHVTIGWTRVPGARFYFVYNGGSYIGRTHSNGFVVAGLGYDTTYTLTVRACRLDGCGPASRPYPITTYFTTAGIGNDPNIFNNVVQVESYDSGLGALGPTTLGCGFFVTDSVLVTSYSVVENDHYWVDVGDFGRGGWNEHAQLLASAPAEDIALLQLSDGASGGAGGMVLGFGVKDREQPTFLVTPTYVYPGIVQSTSNWVTGLTGRYIADTAVAPAQSSGCPLLNPFGDVVGMQVSGSQGGAPAGGGTALAVPISQIEQLMKQQGI